MSDSENACTQCGAPWAAPSSVAGAQLRCDSCGAANEASGSRPERVRFTSVAPGHSLPSSATDRAAVLRLFILAVVSIAATYLVLVNITVVLSVAVIVGAFGIAHLYRDKINDRLTFLFTVHGITTCIRLFAILLVVIGVIRYLFNLPIFFTGMVGDVTKWSPDFFELVPKLQVIGRLFLVMLIAQVSCWFALSGHVWRVISSKRERIAFVLVPVFYLVLLVAGLQLILLVVLLAHLFLMTVGLARKLNSYLKTERIRGASVDVDLAWAVSIMSVIYFVVGPILSSVIVSTLSSGSVARFSVSLYGLLGGLVSMALLAYLQLLVVRLSGQLGDAVAILQGRDSELQVADGNLDDDEGWMTVTDSLDDAQD